MYYCIVLVGVVCCVCRICMVSRGDAEKLGMTMTRNTLALHINARVKFKGKCEISGEILYVGLVHDSAKSKTLSIATKKIMNTMNYNKYAETDLKLNKNIYLYTKDMKQPKSAMAGSC